MVDTSATSGRAVPSSADLMDRALEALAGLGGPVSVEAIHLLTETGDLGGPMTIAEVADLLTVSPHTLRYYERANLVDVERDSRGHRIYSPGAVRRLVFLTRMRLSGMSMRDLQHYVALVEAGTETVPERLDMLIEHRDTLRRQIRELTLSLAATEYKIANYGGAAGD